ncbi:MAG TPA: LytTR family DNA-binding domain-containing protein [Catalimonadaceae bacterium]|nr:LytTR family DNA-binding domain-containing protein [Catalimonadaceae bacterium]
MKNLISTLKEPFPYSGGDLGGRFKIIVGSGIFVALFLVVFQPFGAYEWKNPDKNFLLAGFGIVTAICLATSSFIFPRIYPGYFKEATWTIGKEILNTIFTILLISVGNYVYSISTLNSGYNFSWSQFSFMIWATFLVGLFPSVFITYFNYHRSVKKYSNPPEPFRNSETGGEKIPVQLIKISGEGQKDELEFFVSDFLMAEASGNYVEVFLKNGISVEKKLIRATLSRLQNEIPNPVARCHRSFLVNLNRVEKVSGNAQGYKLHLNFGGLSVPVGRNYSDIIRQKI